MRTTTHRSRAILASFAFAAVIGACTPDGQGYAIVNNRTRDDIAAPIAPPPPLVTGGVPGAGAATPIVATNLPSGVTQAMVDDGQKLFGTACSACHGGGGRGTTIAPALVDDEWLNIGGGFDEIVNIIHTGVPNPKQFSGAMPPLGGGSFDDEQVRKLAAYVYALTNQEGA